MGSMMNELSESQKKQGLVVCECQQWAWRIEPPVTRHHPQCKQYDLKNEAMALVRDLVKGMEAWAADEDGIHREAWDAYKRGKVFVGQFDWTKEES